MNKTQRLVYKELAYEANTNLCSFCKTSESLGCCDGVACTHPLNERYELIDDGNVEPGQDCFLFRPDRKVSDIADIVGIILEYNFHEWLIYTDKKNQLRIKGTCYK